MIRRIRKLERERGTSENFLACAHLCSLHNGLRLEIRDESRVRAQAKKFSKINNRGGRLFDTLEYACHGINASFMNKMF